MQSIDRHSMSPRRVPPAATRLRLHAAHTKCSGATEVFSFIAKRLGLVVPTFLGITLLVFALIRLLPGDPVEALSGERGMTTERYERLIHEFGLDRPLPVQYADYLWIDKHHRIHSRSHTAPLLVLQEFRQRFRQQSFEPSRL